MTSPIPTVRRRILFKNVAVLTDLGSGAEQSLRFAAALAQNHGASLTIAHAYAPDFYVYIPPEPLPTWPGAGLSTKQKAQQRTMSLIGRAGLSHKEVSSVVSSTSIAELLEQLEVRQPDLLVLATHARAGISKWLSGSVTAEVFRGAQWPVLVLPPAALNHQSMLPQFQRILFATDLSDISARAFHYAAGLAGDHGAPIVALHVNPDGTPFSFERLITLQRLEDWLHRHSVLHDDTEHPECIVRCGKPSVEIQEAASEHNSQLIVMGARGFGALAGFASHFVGGTAYEVACKSTCPVLIVPNAH